MDPSANFTIPTNQTAPTDTRGTGDNGEVWNPTGGPNGTGAWEAPPAAAPVHHNAEPIFGAVWGDRNRDTVNGKQVAGTSGTEMDVARYNALSKNKVAAPTLDQTQSNESRNLSMGALGMLRARAEGAETPADVLARNRTASAVNGIYSGAAGIKGGAGARAAAARGAIATGAQLQARGNADAAALHARGIADAANQYLGASTGQRANDLTVAGTNADLAAEQRAANQNDEQFNQQLAWDTMNAQQQAGLNMSVSDQAAANSGRIAAQQAQAAGWNHAMDVASGVTGAASGAISAGNKAGGTPAPTSTPAPSGGPSETGHYGEGGASSSSDNRDIEESDPRAKRDIRPVSNREAGRLKRLGQDMAENSRALLGAGPSVGEKKPEPYDGKYLGSPFPSQPDVISGPTAAPRAPSLDEAMAADVARTRAAEPRYGLFDEDEGGSRDPVRLGARPGYAASRAGQAGYMFGGAPEAIHGFERRPAIAGRAARDRDVAMSDPKAKQEAYALGRAHGFEQVTTGKPVEWSHPMPKDIVDKNEGRAGEGAEQAPTREPTSFKREKPAAPATASLTAPKGAVQRGIDALAARPFTTSPGSPWAGTEAVPAFQQAVTTADKGYRAALADTPPGSARAMTSDPRAKEDVHGSPMAAANRSMEPFSYEYKAEFTPSDQSPHEKNVGPMANKMEADPVARTAIVKDPGTGLLAIDKTKGLKLVMGGLSSLQRQVDQMEKRRA